MRRAASSEGDDPTSGERRRALLEERGDALAGLALLERRQESDALDRQAAVVREVARGVPALDDRRHRGARGPRHPSGDVERLLDDVPRQDAVDEADAPRLLAVDLACGEQELQRPAATHEVRQALGPAPAGDQAE